MADTAEQADWPAGRPPNAQGAEVLDMPPPLDLAQERADAEVEATAYKNSIDQLVSRYEVLMENTYDTDADPEADPKEEMSRLRSLGDEMDQEIRDLGALHADLVGAHTCYHKHICALPKEDRIRVNFTAAFNKFMQEHNVTASMKGALKRIDELRGLHKAAVSSHNRLRQSLPENQLNFDLESEEDSSDGDYVQPLKKGSAEPSSSNSTSRVPAGTSSSRKAAAETHKGSSQKPSSHERSAERTRHVNMNSAEFGDSSKHATDGSAEPPVGKPSSPNRVLGLFKSTFQRPHAKTSPPSRSSSPLRFDADGTSRRKTTSDAHKLYNSAVKTGADFSVYNRNPFYQNSSVKLPIRPNECVPAGTDKYPAPPPLNFKGITDSPFTGDIRSYPSWRDAFIRIVHAPGRVMQDSERLLYLKQCLKGQPLDLVDRYPITDMGYLFATEMLVDTFFDEEKSRFTLRQDLQAVRPPGTGYTDLLRFQQDVLPICGNFYAAGEDITRNDWCSDIVMSKLPYSVRHTLNQRKEAQRDESPWTIAQLLEELHSALKLMKKSALYDGGPSQPAGSKSKNNRFQAFEGPHASSAERHGGTFVGAITKDPKSRSCAFCGVKGSHWPTDCPNYPTVSSRYERLKELNFCFVCLQPDHWRNNAKACRAVNTGACSSCAKAFHHKALCPVFLEKRRNGGSRQQDRRNKKSSNRYQRGAGPIQDPKNGRQTYRGQHGGGVPVAPGGTALHPTRYAPNERQSHPGRAQTHAAAAIDNEEAGATYMAEPSTGKKDGASGPPGASQQPAGSPQVAATSVNEPAHLRHIHGQETHPIQDDGQFSVVTHDSDAPTEPDEDDMEPFDPSSFYSGYAAVGVAHISEARTHATFLECGLATVFNPTTNKRKRVCVFFDCGFTGTFVSYEVARELGLPNLGNDPIRLDTFAQDKPVRLDTFHTQLGVEQIDGSCLVLNLKASPKLVPPLEAVFIQPSDVPLLKTNQYELVPRTVVPDILIGKNVEHLFFKEYDKKPLPSGFTLLTTTLGTILSGCGQFRKRSADLTSVQKGSADPTRPRSNIHVSAETTPPLATPLKEVRFADALSVASTAHNASAEALAPGSADPHNEHSTSAGPAETSRVSMFFARKKEEESLHEMAQNFWQTENIGIEKNDPRKEDAVVHERIKKSIRLSDEDEGRYQANAHQPEFLRKYGKGFDQMEADGVIEKFNIRDKSISFLHFLAHHAVVKESSATTKVRSVFDGSAHLPGLPSINDFLHRGPVLLPTMTGILLRTRVHGIVIIADIAKAFLQVSLHPTDRSACAFLWLKDPTKPPDDDNLVFYRFRRVTFGLNRAPTY